MTIERFTMDMVKQKREEIASGNTVKSVKEKISSLRKELEQYEHEETMEFIYTQIKDCLKQESLVKKLIYCIGEYQQYVKNDIPLKLLDKHQKIIDQLQEDGYKVEIKDTIAEFGNTFSGLGMLLGIHIHLVD